MRWVRRCLTAGLVGLVVALGAAGAAGAAGLPSTAFGADVFVRSVDDQLTPSDLSVGSAAGMGVARIGTFDGVTANSDAIVGFLAEAHLRLYPNLGVPCPSGESSCANTASSAPAVAAGQMAQIVTAFARRYGPGGSFWTANPQLPYEPIESFEIGNEPNLPLYWVVDGTHLHWAYPSDPNAVDAADYAEVYEAARSALHAVDPSAKAIVGGLADSASGGVDVAEDEQFLSAFAPGTIDAVGFHPWVFDVSDSLLEPDTSGLRTWMDAHGFSAAPLDINEIGACQYSAHDTDAGRCPASESQTSAQWGQVATNYMKWALCTPAMNVENVEAFDWGDVPATATDVYLALFDSSGAVTPYGTDYLNLVRQLSTTGCTESTTSSSSTSSTSTTSSSTSTTPTTSSSTSTTRSTTPTTSSSTSPTRSSTTTTPTTSSSTSTATSSSGTTQTATTLGGAPATTTTTQTTTSAKPRRPSEPATTSGMFRIERLRVRGKIVTILVERVLSDARVTAVARRTGRRRSSRRLTQRATKGQLITFRSRLSSGRWRLTLQEARIGSHPMMRLHATITVGGHRAAERRHTHRRFLARVADETGFSLRTPIVEGDLSVVVPPDVNVACLWRDGSDWSPWRTSCVAFPALPALG
jgi:hypothetical protein